MVTFHHNQLLYQINQRLADFQGIFKPFLIHNDTFQMS